MSDRPQDLRLRALPAQVVKIEGGAIVRRDRIQLRVHGEGVEAVLGELLGLAARDGASREELHAGIMRRFPSLSRAPVDQLIDSLSKHRILVDVEKPGPAQGWEDPLEIFYWNYDVAWTEAVPALSRRTIVVLGVNVVTRRLAEALKGCGFDDCRVVDEESLRNLRLFDDDGALRADRWPETLQRPISSEAWAEKRDVETPDLLIAASDFGGQHLLRDFNAFAVGRRIPFLPISLQDHIGQVGPLVVPTETACLECLRARQNSNMPSPDLQRATEPQAFVGQVVTGFHPSMPAIMSEVAAMELTKFFSPRLPGRRAGTLIEIDLMGPSLATRKVLKIPRCSVCGNVNRVSSNNPDKKEFLPDLEAA